MVINAIVSMTAILSLSFIQWSLLEHGIDGTLAIIIVSAVAGIAGFNVSRILGYLKEKK